MLILHVARPEDWNRGQRGDGVYRPASLDDVGHIYGCRLHFATIVANSIFRAEDRLTLVGIDSRLLRAPIVWAGPNEQPKLWPNIGGSLNLDAVAARVEWLKTGDRFPRVPSAIRSLDCGPEEAARHMEVGDVVEVLSVLEAATVRVVVEGGWAVDALVGHQTRAHGDLDVAVQTEDFDKLHAAMGNAGFELVTDERPLRVLLRDRLGRKLDIHPRDLGGRWYASVTTNGAIGGATVVCLNLERQVEQHTKYELGERDYVDLEQLRRLATT